MSIPLTSEAYVIAAAEALEKAGQQTHAAGAMDAHTRRAATLLDMARLLAEREAAELAPPEPALPAAFLDCHDRRWQQVGDDGDYQTDDLANPFHITAVREVFGPLRALK